MIGSGGSKDIEKHSDIYKFKEQCGTTSVMIARAAQWNVSIFKKDNCKPKQNNKLKAGIFVFTLKVCFHWTKS